MNVYDTANKLAGEIKQSYLQQFHARKIQKFEKIRYEVQVELMQTGKNNEEKYKKMQDSYSELIQDAEAKRFFEAETKFNILIADVNKIIGEAISDVI